MRFWIRKIGDQGGCGSGWLGYWYYLGILVLFYEIRGKEDYGSGRLRRLLLFYEIGDLEELKQERQRHGDREMQRDRERDYYYFTILNTFERLFRLPAIKDFS
jgi:hypothetical protein